MRLCRLVSWTNVLFVHPDFENAVQKIRLKQIILLKNGGFYRDCNNYKLELIDDGILE